MTILKILRALAVLSVAPVLLGACERGVEAPAGAVILTAAGNITKTNRGPYDEKRDTLFKYHEVTFD
jgi:hypothetical protein